MNRTLLAGIILAAALPMAAMAQTSGRGTEPQARGSEASRDRGRVADLSPEERGQRTERHLRELRTLLRITPAQMPKWEDFATATRENATEMHARFTQRGAEMARLNAAQNMADYAQIAELHARQLVRLAASFTALYATFSPDQQRDADLHFRNRRAPAPTPAG